MVDIEIELLADGEGRIVLGLHEVDIYLQNPVPVYNITSVDNFLNATASSGTIVFSSFPPEGIDMFNRRIGIISQYNTESGTFSNYPNLVLESNLRRTNIPISGSKLAGQR